VRIERRDGRAVKHFAEGIGGVGHEDAAGLAARVGRRKTESVVWEVLRGNWRGLTIFHVNPMMIAELDAQ
jgi:hypothetical protein